MWISCRIKSDSHTLTDAAFQLLQLPESNIRVYQIRDRDFIISVRAIDETAPGHTQLHHGHHAINAVLIALNVATIGCFYWHSDPWAHPIMTITDDLDGTNPRSGTLVVTSDTTYEALKPLEEQDIYNTILIFGILARETSSIITEEYCRGLILLRTNFYDINFRREAFLCFYRAFENLVSARILKVAKLKNELRDLKRALMQVGASQELVEELREVYAIRSSQVAHSQINQREITFDEVMKTKVFLDFIMHKTFKTQAN